MPGPTDGDANAHIVRQMSVFRYSADRPRVALFAALFAVDIAVYLTIDSPLVLLAYFAIGILPKGCVCAFNHHHQHVQTFRNDALNRLLEVMYALQTGVTSHAWVLHHSVGHHLNYLDQSKDQSRWMRKDQSVMGKLEYTVANSLAAYPRAFQVGAKYTKFRRTFVWMGLVTMAIVAALVSYRPLPGLIVFVLAPVFSLFGTVYATYTHHSDRPTDSPFVASTNVLQPFYNLCTGNLGYHTAHHYRPGVHWSKLPTLHAKIDSKIPDDAFAVAGLPWRLVGTGSLAERFGEVRAELSSAAPVATDSEWALIEAEFERDLVDASALTDPVLR
jgi:fatty acid desaturase